MAVIFTYSMFSFKVFCFEHFAKLKIHPGLNIIGWLIHMRIYLIIIVLKVIMTCFCHSKGHSKG